jgi:hypothetical protein
MTHLRSLLTSRASIIGIVTGTVYGIVARLAVEAHVFAGTLAVMSLAFLFLVPFVLGALTVMPVESPSVLYQIFAPWVPTTLVVITAGVVGWEGAICIIMSLPMLLVYASIGGLIGGASAARRRGIRPVLAALPFLAAPLEKGVQAPARLVETVTQIHIAASPAVVWPLIASVDSIRPEEQRSALFIALGFPRPISATISGSGVGAVRSARFERGLVFTETVTDWKPERRLSFTIDPNTESIPPTTLDPHVTIGGPFFDVLTGTYELEALDRGRSTRLTLRSQHRVSTRFNYYAGWWANRIMASIQRNILEVHKSRAERLERPKAVEVSAACDRSEPG